MDVVVSIITAPPVMLQLFLLVFATTELAKRLFRMLFNRYGKEEIWFAAFLSGLIWAYYIWPVANIIPWYIPGFFTGPVVAFLHRVGFAWIKQGNPAIHKALTGERRKRKTRISRSRERRK